MPISSTSFSFANDTATTEIYTLSLHDALPILHQRPDRLLSNAKSRLAPAPARWCSPAHTFVHAFPLPRSEEHTSELQSLRHLVCRLLLEKKKKAEPAAMLSSA